MLSIFVFCDIIQVVGLTCQELKFCLKAQILAPITYYQFSLKWHVHFVFWENKVIYTNLNNPNLSVTNYMIAFDGKSYYFSFSSKCTLVYLVLYVYFPFNNIYNISDSLRAFLRKACLQLCDWKECDDCWYNLVTLLWYMLRQVLLHHFYSTDANVNMVERSNNFLALLRK